MRLTFHIAPAQKKRKTMIQKMYQKSLAGANEAIMSNPWSLTRNAKKPNRIITRTKGIFPIT